MRHACMLGVHGRPRVNSLAQLQQKPEFFAVSHLHLGFCNANEIQNSILAQQAKSDIDNAMQGKGFQLVQESANPDIILTASGGMKQQTSYSAMGSPGSGGGTGTTHPTQTPLLNM